MDFCDLRLSKPKTTKLTNKLFLKGHLKRINAIKPMQTIILWAKFSLRPVLLKRASQTIKVHVSTDPSDLFPFSTYKAILAYLFCQVFF